MQRIVEICCGSLEDAIVAEKAGADRIELNNALYLGGLTPSIGTINLVAEKTNIPVAVMVRPRPGGFNYNDYEFQTMIADTEAMAVLDIEGVVFGCLNDKSEIDEYKNKKLIEIIHKHNKDAIFHRAFDCVKDPYKSIEVLIDMGVKRVLTSGLKRKAIDGVDVLAKLQKNYGDKIEILAGSGVNATNCSDLIKKTGISQYHSSCTTWRHDPTTISNVSYSFAAYPNEENYNIVSFKTACEFVQAVKNE